MPMISAATPMLLIMDNTRTPAMLMIVPTTIATRAMKTEVFNPKMLGGTATPLLDRMASNGMGIVNATPVIVITPAKK